MSTSPSIIDDNQPSSNCQLDILRDIIGFGVSENDRCDLCSWDEFKHAWSNMGLGTNRQLISLLDI